MYGMGRPQATGRRTRDRPDRKRNGPSGPEVPKGLGALRSRTDRPTVAAMPPRALHGHLACAPSMPIRLSLSDGESRRKSLPVCRRPGGVGTDGCAFLVRQETAIQARRPAPGIARLDVNRDCGRGEMGLDVPGVDMSRGDGQIQQSRGTLCPAGMVFPLPRNGGPAAPRSPQGCLISGGFRASNCSPSVNQLSVAEGLHRGMRQGCVLALPERCGAILVMVSDSCHATRRSNSFSPVARPPIRLVEQQVG
jgi:hypothetical protein